MSTEQLIIELDAKTAKLDAKLSKVERQLDGVEGATKKTDKSLMSMSKAGEIAAKGIAMIAGAGTAAAAALTAATAAAISYSKELRIASNRSGESVERLQSLAFATKTVGIDLEKLGDITKDTRERLGEFTRDGTGGFNDFVSVARLTKEEANQLAGEFQHLTGTEVLQRMVDRMEEAGATANQMSFALEGVASDTTDLIPLLVNGGEKLAILEKDFNDLGVTLTKLDIQKITKLGAEVSKLGAKASGASKKVVAVLSEDIEGILNLMAGASKDMGGLVIKAVTGYQSIVVSGTSKVLNYFRETRIRLLEDKAFIVGIFGDNSEILAEVAKLKESDVLRDAFDAEYIAGQWDIAKEKIKDYYGELKAQEEEAPEITTPATTESEEEQEKSLSVKEEEDLERLQQFLMTRAELLDQQLIDDLERLNEAAEATGTAETDLYARRLEIIQDFANKKEALEKKQLKNKDKDTKTEEKWSNSSTKKMMDDGTMLLNSLGNNSKTAHKIKQGLAASNAFMNTAEGVTDALADQNYASAAIIAATGAAQIAAILSSSPDAPGGGGTSTPAEPAPPEEFVPETAGLEFTDATATGSTQQTIRFAVDSGDDLIDAIAGALNKAQNEGRA